MDGDSRFSQVDLCRDEVRERLVSRLLVRVMVPEEERTGIHKRSRGKGGGTKREHTGGWQDVTALACPREE